MLRYNKKRTQLAWFTALLSSVARAVTGDQRLKFLCLFRPLRAEHLVNFPSRSRPSPRARPWKALVHRVFFLRPFNELSAFYKKVDASAKTLHYRKNMACVSISLLIFAISLVLRAARSAAFYRTMFSLHSRKTRHSFIDWLPRKS